MDPIKIDQLIRSRRRTTSIEIDPAARLVVRASERADLRDIERFILRKSRWILDKQEIARQKTASLVPREYSPGEHFPYLGANYRLSLVDRGAAPLSLEQEFLLIKHFAARARPLFLRWYREQATKMIRERLELYSQRSGIKFIGFRITNAQKRWGSCSGKGNLSFSWRLVMAPLSIIDYVVAHELAHVEQKNHSRAFWVKVWAIYPEYRECRNWLKEHGHILVV